MLYLLGYVWVSPLSLVGFIIAILGNAKFSSWRPAGHLLFVASGAGAADWFFRSWHMGATTIGVVTIFANEVLLTDERLLRHEFTHTKQAMVLGILFPFAYYGASFLAWARGKSWYLDNWFEVQARKAEEVKT